MTPAPQADGAGATAPVLMAFLAAVIWGLWWIPIRHLETLGLSGAWAGIAMNSGAFLAAAVWVVLRRAPLRLAPRVAMGAALVGVAVTTFSTAINYADVVRVILLFYLAPAWSKIIERVFMNRPWRWTATAALTASFSGAILVLGGKVSAAAIGFGDVLAIVSGMCWAAGAALVFSGGRSGSLSLTLVTSFCAVAAGLPFVLLQPAPVIAAGAASVALGAGFGLIYVLPILVLTLWSAQRLSPSTLSFLLTAEILSGVISGALFLNEPFGLMQAAGAALIVLGALTEVLSGMRSAAGGRA